MRPASARVRLLTVGLLAFVPGLTLVRTALAQETIALVGGRVHPGEGGAVENATVLVRDGRIVSVTSGGAVPSGATTVDCRSMVITPGFVASASPLGLVEIGAEDSTNDQAPETPAADPVRASFRAADAYNPRSTLIPVARRYGVTSVVTTPTGGLFSGTSAWMDLRGPTLDETMSREITALHVDLGDGGIAAAGGSRASALGRVREVLDDATLFRRGQAAFDRRGLRELSVSRLDLVRVSEALAGEIPVVIRVSRASDILRVLELGRTYGLRLILSGVEEGWMVAPQIAAASVPVIVRPLTNLPGAFSVLHSRYDNAAILNRAGVRVIIGFSDAHQQSNLRQEAGNAIAHGLSFDAALAGLTVEPARAFGLADRYGAIAPGRVANLVVWNGDPFELTTWAAHVFIRGQEVPLATRQTRLFERYRELTQVPQGVTHAPRE